MKRKTGGNLKCRWLSDRSTSGKASRRALIPTIDILEKPDFGEVGGSKDQWLLGAGGRAVEQVRHRGVLGQ